MELSFGVARGTGSIGKESNIALVNVRFPLQIGRLNTREKTITILREVKLLLGDTSVYLPMENMFLNIDL